MARTFAGLQGKEFLKVMTWNILCDSLSDAFDRVPKELLVWEHRQPLIVAHILEQAPDVVCLQEVDRYDSLMSGLGEVYEGTCCMKLDGEMGCAILWRKGVVKAIEAP